MSTSRRTFLKQAGLAAVGFPALINSASAMLRPRSCVVIGAGLSGLAAAYRLKSAGWQVSVWEARDRIGGRVLSHRLPENPDLVCELGGEWVGASHERVRALCKDFEIPLQDHRFNPSLLRNGAIIRPGQWSFSAQANAAFEKLRKQYEKYTPADKQRLDHYDWWTWLQKIGFTDDDLRLRDLQDSTDFGESIREVSAFAAASEYFESDENDEMDFKMTGGNSRLPAEFAQRIGSENIHLGVAVTDIIQRTGSISIGRRETEGGKLAILAHADACICTVPPRVLDRIRFDPALPSIQANAAEQLQYARITKTSVLYEKRFWGPENFSLVSDVTSHYYYHSTQNQPGVQGILTSYAIGEKSDVLAAQDDRRKMAIVAGDLIPLEEHAPRMARGIASYTWQRDPLTLGAYAIYRPGQWFDIRPKLQAPHGRVLFAGEHLADWQGFMEGAVETGESAADQLIGPRRTRK